MKKKTFVALLLSILAVFCIFTLVACNNKPGETDATEETSGTLDETEKPDETETSGEDTSDTDASETSDTTATETEYTGPCKHEETTILEAVAPDCITAGRSEGVKCANEKCGAVLTPQRRIPANGHSYDVDLGMCTVEGCAKPELVFTTDGIIYTLNAAGDGYIVEGFSEGVTMTIIAIPATYKDLPVVAIADGAFENSTLTNVIVSRGMTTIGKDAFKGSLVLKEVLLSDTVTTIGEGAFNTCEVLPKINLRKVTAIGTDAFAGCKALTELTVDEANGNFSSVSGILYNKAEDTIIHIPAVLKGDLIIPDGITELADNAFKGASGITSVTFGTGLKKVGANAFLGCSGVKKVTVSSLEAWLAIEFNGMFSTPCYYAKSLYIGDTQLAGAVAVPAGTEAIGAWAFAYFGDITSITIPAGVKSIGSNAFYGCRGLTTLTLPEGLETIGDSAFYYCENLSEVTIPASVKTIADRAFKGCSALTTINFGGTKAEWNAITKGIFWDDNADDYTVVFAK